MFYERKLTKEDWKRIDRGEDTYSNIYASKEKRRKSKLDEKTLEKVETNTPLKLYLGCFDKPIHNFVNVDIRPDVNPDVVDNAFTLEKFEESSADLILTVHMAEHLNYKEAEAAFKRWYAVLKPGGKLYISVPDMEKVFAYYFLHRNLRELYPFVWGSQKHVADFHSVGWDEQTLREDLEQAGFVDVKRYRWQDTEWSYVDSYEKAFKPHMDFERGVLMSLNVCATKPT